jgi:hypothetical protein
MAGAISRLFIFDFVMQWIFTEYPFRYLKANITILKVYLYIQSTVIAFLKKLDWNYFPNSKNSSPDNFFLFR